jgi:glycosyltransferase involved in cell wall biosynthesis
VRAFAAASLQNVSLLLAGGDSGQRVAVEGAVRAAGIEQQVQMFGAVEDQDLPALCAGALCFVYPSRHEGFGLQICEALAAGCPTLAARATSLPEVLGDGGVLFSLDNTNELTLLLRRMAGDPAWRSNLVENAKLRSRAFSWKRAAEKTLDTAYVKAIQARHR